MPDAQRSPSRGCTTQSHQRAGNPTAHPETSTIEAVRDLLDGLTPAEWRNVQATIRAFDLGLLELPGAGLSRTGGRP